MPRFFVSQALEKGSRFHPEPRVLQHLKVLRLEAPTTWIAFNGDGYDYQVDWTKSGFEVTHVSQNRSEAQETIHVATALLKGDKMDWVIQKLVELGVTRLLPIVADRCEQKMPSEPKRMANKLAHWQGIVQSASEQCGRSVLMQIMEPRRLQDWFSLGDSLDTPGHVHAFLSLKAKEPLRPSLFPAMTLWVGPEGGWSDREEALVDTQPFLRRVSLGPRILRAETAAIAGAALCLLPR